MRALLPVLLFLIAWPVAAQNNDLRTETVRFPPRSSGTTITDRIRGYEYVDYRLGAGAGQWMTVELDTDNNQNYFNVLAPGESDIAFFIGSTEGNSFQGSLPDSGTYTIRVYMMRAAARRDETADYRLSIAITGQPSSNPPLPTERPGDALVPGTPYHATGPIPCRFGGDASVTSCEFGVIRRGGGDAQIDITFPDGFKRTLFHENGQWMSPNSGEVTAARFGDESEVIVNGAERFTIPDAVMFGG